MIEGISQVSHYNGFGKRVKCQHVHWLSSTLHMRMWIIMRLSYLPKLVLYLQCPNYVATDAQILTSRPYKNKLKYIKKKNTEIKRHRQNVHYKINEHISASLEATDVVPCLCTFSSSSGFIVIFNPLEPAHTITNIKITFSVNLPFVFIDKSILCHIFQYLHARDEIYVPNLAHQTFVYNLTCCSKFGT